MSVVAVNSFPSTATPRIAVKKGSTVAIMDVLTGPRIDSPFMRVEKAITVDASASTNMYDHTGMLLGNSSPRVSSAAMTNVIAAPTTIRKVETRVGMPC